MQSRRRSRQIRTDFIQICDQCACKLIRIPGVCGICNSLERGQHRIGNGFDKYFVDLCLDCGCSFVCYLRRNGIFFCIGVIGNLRFFNITGKYTHQVRTEIFRDYDRCVIFSGFYTLHCFTFGCKYPVELCILPKSRQYLIAKIQLERDQVSGIAFIYACYGNLQIPRIPIGIPACRNVEPCIKAGNHCDAENDDQRNDICSYFPDISCEDGPHISHSSFPSFTFLRNSSSDRWI